VKLGRIGPYGLIAALCALANLVILVAGERAGFHYVVSISVSFVVCVILGYTLHSRFTYAARVDRAGLVRYTGAMALNYPLSIVAVWFFNELLAWPMIVAAPASTLALTLYNFFSSRWAILGRTAAG
jgi:putative flippase GtrA